MSRHRDGFLDALASGRRPRGYRADEDDGALLRTAIELGAERPGDAVPSAQFVEELHRTLSAQAELQARPARPSVTSRARTMIAAAAAAAVLIGGTAAVTEALATTTPSAQAPSGSPAVLTGTFAATDRSVQGTIVALQGRPSWIVLAVSAPSRTDHQLICMLQLHDGSIAAMGTVQLNHGIGELHRPISVNVNGLRGARLVSSTGQTVAVAHFA